jgi:hypothetical protein
MQGKCRTGCIGIRDLHRGFCGSCLKLKGVKQVLAHESQAWKKEALRAIRATAGRYITFTADQVKDTADTMGLSEPHHPNCWGGIFHSALKKGYMHQTGQFIASTRAKHHKQRIAEYQSGVKPPVIQTEEEKWKARAIQARGRYWEAQEKIDQLEKELEDG